MEQVHLYTLPQWIIFVALFGIIYGWVEGKKYFRIIGLSFMVLLGIFSASIVSGNYLSITDASAPMNAETFSKDDIPMQVRLLPAYWSFVASAVLALVAILLDWKDKKYAKLLIVVTAIASLIGFFMIVGMIRSL